MTINKTGSNNIITYAELATAQVNVVEKKGKITPIFTVTKPASFFHNFFTGSETTTKQIPLKGLRITHAPQKSANLRIKEEHINDAFSAIYNTLIAINGLKNCELGLHPAEEKKSLAAIEEDVEALNHVAQIEIGQRLY